jgi:hypothetical protein
MGNNQDILDQYPKDNGNKIIKNPNTYLEGIKKFQLIIRGKDPNLVQFKKHLGNRSTGLGIEIDADEHSEEEGNESEEM